MTDMTLNDCLEELSLNPVDNNCIEYAKRAIEHATLADINEAFTMLHKTQKISKTQAKDLKDKLKEHNSRDDRRVLIKELAEMF